MLLNNNSRLPVSCEHFESPKCANNWAKQIKVYRITLRFDKNKKKQTRSAKKPFLNFCLFASYITAFTRHNKKKIKSTMENV